MTKNKCLALDSIGLILTEQLSLLNCPPEAWPRSYTLAGLTGTLWLLSERSGQDTKQSLPRQHEPHCHVREECGVTPW